MKLTGPDYLWSQAQADLSMGSDVGGNGQRTNLKPWLLGSLGIVMGILVLITGTQSDECARIARPFIVKSADTAQGARATNCGLAVPEGQLDHNLRHPESDAVKPNRPPARPGIARRALV